ncbi:efflux RND transporter permease subunit, partial [Vibrio parahaemolyticus]|nr:efflux RND transporter permease subunit [Vibrio parahaemolyticus]
WLGLDISMMSTFGLIAAAGVVINDSLVMTDYVNQVRENGMSIKLAVVEAGCARFRAITLTSITTFAGVLPIMFETSLQARFVIPMAVALGFAVLYATVLTLVLVPCLYLMLEDIKNIFRAIKRFFQRVIGRFRKASVSSDISVNTSN